jgi:exodeoxyribonuclease-3
MTQKLKLISWNVNGIRAAVRKGFVDYIKQEDPDIICIQETKAWQGQAQIDLPEYIEYWNSAQRKGYSGTAIFTKIKPIAIINDLQTKVSLADKYGDPNTEGRVITAEFEKFYVVTVYTPNSKRDLSRLELRHKKWDVEFLKSLKELEKTKPVIFCGDFNVAHTELDLARPDSNHFTHGFTDEEREGFSNFLSSGFVDTFRQFNKDGENYTWWSPMSGARQRNIGWRIDYICVSSTLKDNIKSAFIRSEVLGSDHCPVGIELKV